MLAAANVSFNRASITKLLILVPRHLEPRDLAKMRMAPDGTAVEREHTSPCDMIRMLANALPQATHIRSRG